ncbi:MAG: RecX family transcriptional regulator [Spirochaetaceae bacterium]|nr:RecX family transcriptional regulator [Spirochaetaceae bacterium]
MAEHEQTVHDAEKTALRLIARAEQSKMNLLKKLRVRGFSSSIVKKAVQQLCETGMVDDARYAFLWTAARINRKIESPRSLIMLLRNRGIPPQTAAHAVRKALESAGEIEFLRKYLVKEKNVSHNLLSKQKLLAEGFSTIAIETVIEED